MEGVVAKRLDSVYAPGVRTEQLAQDQERAAARKRSWPGTSPGKGNRTGQVGSLLIGVHDDSGLIYAGTWAPGSPTRRCGMLGDKLAAAAPGGLAVRRPGAARACPPAVWVEPRLVIEVTFDRWTRAGRMRAPVYKGLRDDIDPAGRDP